MLLVLILLFTALPLTELYLLFKAGAMIGAGWTLLIVLATGILGAAFAKRQGREILFRAQSELSQGRLPADQLIHGLLVFAGGLLLMTPGFITDVMGLCMVLPPTRVLLLYLMKRMLSRGLRSGHIHIYTNRGSFGGGAGAGGGPFQGYTMGHERIDLSADESEYRPPARDVTPKKPS